MTHFETKKQAVALEDDFEDVLGKAMCGLEWKPAQLARESGLSEASFTQLVNGVFDAPSLIALAPFLQLDTEKWLNHPHYKPSVSPPHGLHQFTSPFGYLGVNAFAIETPDTWFIFDTGTNAQELLALTQDKPRELFLTHEHPDHTACESELSPNIVHRAGEISTPISRHNLKISPLQVPGHANPATAYYIEGLQTPVCILGDSLFAGSMGKCSGKSTFTQAKRTIIENILTLPHDTILCPGHGPLTTVAQELDHNPFF